MKMKHQEDISCIPDDCFTEITRHSPISRKYGQPHKKTKIPLIWNIE